MFLRFFSKILMFYIALLTFFSRDVVAEPCVIDPSTKISFPVQIHVEDSQGSHQLKVTGVSTRVKSFTKTFSIAHYMEDPPKEGRSDLFYPLLIKTCSFETVLIKWVVDVPLEKMKNEYLDAFKISLSPDQWRTLSTTIHSFVGFYQDQIKSGDEHMIRRASNGEIILSVNGKEKGRLKDGAFAEALWSLWLGPKAIVSRSRLISLL